MFAGVAWEIQLTNPDRKRIAFTAIDINGTTAERIFLLGEELDLPPGVDFQTPDTVYYQPGGYFIVIFNVVTGSTVRIGMTFY